ncbi:MAG: hypothetical protein GY811_17825 [Myxococcales bacterium]|nr:hypothetical protein [Myxococcales bacterium]
MLRIALTAALALSALAGVSSCGSDAPVTEQLRDDLIVTTYQSRISNGLSERLTFDIPAGVDSFLIEVRGDKGLYYLTELITPAGRDVIEGARYTTRASREVPGLVDWLYPNSPEITAQEGTYTLTVRGVNAYTGNNLDEDIKVLIYTADKKPADTCGIQVDFLVDDAALGEATFSAAVARIVEQLDLSYRQVGIKIANYQVYRVNMQSSDINLGDDSAISIVDDVLDKTLPIKAAREDAVHVMLVRRIGGSNNPNFDPAGYSMGLPGPWAADRDTSAVMVSTELYADGSGSLDADGLASSLAHEMGHFLGLYHTSERDGADHDPLDDTAQCDSQFTCTDEFRRNIMTSSFWLGVERPSFRNRFSESQGRVMRGHPLCQPMSVDVVSPPIEECTLECTAPNTCAVISSRTSCELACDPQASTSCETGECLSDELGTYVCTELPE